MATEETKQKKSFDDVNFLGLGEEPGGDQEEVIVDDSQVEQEEESQQQEEEQEQVEESGQEEEEQSSSQEQETQEGETSEDQASAQSEEEDEGDSETSETDQQEEGEEQESTEEGDAAAIFTDPAEDLGIDVDSEEFEDINFDDPSTEDLKKFIDKASEQMTEKKWNSLIEDNEELQGFYEYTQNGGDPRQYIETMYPEIDYSQVDFEEHVGENDQAQAQIVRNHLLKTDQYDQEEIEEIIEDYRNGGILDKQAKRSLNKLESMQEQEQQKLIEEQEERKKEQKRKAQERREQIQEVIDENESIKGIKLPKEEKDALKEYIFEPVNEQGHSQAVLDGQQMDYEERVAIAYLKMKGFDFETLIENEAETRNAKRVMDKVKKSKEQEQPTKNNKRQEQRKKSQGSINDITPVI